MKNNSLHFSIDILIFEYKIQTRRVPPQKLHFDVVKGLTGPRGST